MTGGGGGAAPQPVQQVNPLPPITPLPPPAPLPAPIPTLLDPAVKQRRQDERRIAALAGGRASTVFTSPQGLAPVTDNPAGRKTLLGQ